MTSIIRTLRTTRFRQPQFNFYYFFIFDPFDPFDVCGGNNVLYLLILFLHLHSFPARTFEQIIPLTLHLNANVFR